MKYILILIALICTSALAGVYKYTDENGNVVFTDAPPVEQETEEVDLPELQTTEKYRPSGSTYTAPGTKKSTKRSGAQARFEVTLSPEDGASIRANGGQITASVNITPAPEIPVTVNFYVDGALVAESESTSAEISGLDRGEHSIEAELIASETGLILARTAPSNVIILRASVLRRQLQEQQRQKSGFAFLVAPSQ